MTSQSSLAQFRESIKNYEDNTSYEQAHALPDKKWMYSWVQQLKEYEIVERCRYGRSDDASHSDLDDFVVKVRERLGQLQTQMPAWVILEKIADNAHRMALEMEATLDETDDSEEYDSETLSDFARKIEQKVKFSVDKNKDNDISSCKIKIIQHHISRNFVSRQVLRMLAELYGHLEVEEKKIVERNINYEQRGEWSPYMAVDDKILLIGPVGERPIHVCALLAARYRLEDEGKKAYIADGIVEAIQDYLTSHRSELHVSYGKDYVAFVSNMLESKEIHGNDYVAKNPPRSIPAPFLGEIEKWYKSRQNKLGNPEKANRHQKAIVNNGLYEGETIIYPFIASNDVAAVKWIVNESKDWYKTAAVGTFFRPVYRQWLSTFSTVEGWRWYSQCRGSGRNPFASSGSTYFGFDVLSFAASQGHVDIFNIVLGKLVDSFESSSIKFHSKIILKAKKSEKFRSMTESWFSSVSKGSKLDESVYTSFIQTLMDFAIEKALPNEPILREKTIQKALVNCKDEFGNTALHLAAWNGKKEMYDLLVHLGASQSSRNKDGFTAFTLSVRFGLWDMFGHIWKQHFSHSYWRFGSVEANLVDYNQFESLLNGQTALTVREIDRCVKALVQHEIMEKCLPEYKETDPTSTSEFTRSLNAEKKVWYEKILEKVIIELFKDQKEEDTSEVEDESENQENIYDYKSASKVITLFRPNGWHTHSKELMEEEIISRWSQGYYLVHIGDSLIPYCLLVLLFGLMWSWRRLNVLEHNFWWAKGTIHAPDPNFGVESTCGWSAIQNSSSGWIQAFLASYGVLSLLRLAFVQRRLRPSDLDENIDWKITTDEIINFLYLNLESLMHLTIAGLFITILFARAGAGDSCDVDYVRLEKNCTAVAALGLFFNLFILCKPYTGLGRLVMTWYRFLLSDVFNFLAMYSIIFVAFLLALQNEHRANYEFLMWMDQTDTIFPRVQQAIGRRFPLAANLTDLTYLENTNPINNSYLLSTEVALNGCAQNRYTMDITAFSLVEISFGDGLADAIQQARSKPYECAGFQPDYLTGCLLVLWIFLSNTLILNMLISMMIYTLHQQSDNLSNEWLLDVSKRILRYEKAFSELAPRMTRPKHSFSIFNRNFWKDRIEDALVILFCIPEVHFLYFLVTCCRLVLATTETPENDGQQDNPSSPPRRSWTFIQELIDNYKTQNSGPRGLNHICVQNSTLNTVRYLHSTGRKAVIFGRNLENQKTAKGGEMMIKGRVEMLIYRLKELRTTLQNKKLKIRPAEVGNESTLSKSVNSGQIKPREAPQPESAGPRYLPFYLHGTA